MDKRTLVALILVTLAAVVAGCLRKWENSRNVNDDQSPEESGLWPGTPEVDFLRKVGSTVSEHIKQLSAHEKSLLPNFCDEDLLKKIEQALNGLDRQGKINWNLVFNDIQAHEYSQGMKRLLVQLERCVKYPWETKALKELIEKAKEIIAKRESQLKKCSPTYESHKRTVDMWKGLLQRLEALRGR